jgi:hypothetical protein
MQENMKRGKHGFSLSVAFSLALGSAYWVCVISLAEFELVPKKFFFSARGC